MRKQIGLIGAGGMAREAIPWILHEGSIVNCLYDNTINEPKAIHDEFIITNEIKLDLCYIMAVGYPETKQKIIKSIPVDKKIKWSNAIIHPSCEFGHYVSLGEGSIIYPFTIISSYVKIGKLSSINSNVTIGHDCKIGEMFHASAGVTISGNVTIGDRVFFGANSCTKENLYIHDDVIIGAGSVVIKDITEPGIYAGNPAKFIKR
jgi:sugar O-acyltransferase (sialic acid O-acetyltransferase NeuD family)